MNNDRYGENSGFTADTREIYNVVFIRIPITRYNAYFRLRYRFAFLILKFNRPPSPITRFGHTARAQSAYIVIRRVSATVGVERPGKPIPSLVFARVLHKLIRN